VNTVTAEIESSALPAQTWARGRNTIVALALAGWAASALGLAADPARFALSYLVAYLFFLSLALGALFFVMVQHLSGAVWSVSSRRIAETLMATLPAAAFLFVPVALNLHHLYEWTHPEVVAADPVLQGKQAYLNVPFFLIRAAVCLLVWVGLSRILYRWSVTQDRRPEAPLRKVAAWSAAGVLLAVLTVTVAAFDWVMSLEPHWFSTVFGVYFYAGGAAASVAALILILFAFRRAGRLVEEVHAEHYHDYGKWLFSLIVFWAYIAFSQYMLIWYANLPEETQWFRTRTQGGWGPVALALVAGHFLIPFFALISRAAKRNVRWLAAMSLWVILFHYLDLYWQVMPAVHRSGPSWHWLDVATWLAVGASLALAFWHKLRDRALLPVGDPRLARSLEFHNV